MGISKKIGKGIKYSQKIRRSKFIPLTTFNNILTFLPCPSVALCAGGRM